jgi:pimeloyl-ACP methyl ester carboxylesterase
MKTLFLFDTISAQQRANAMDRAKRIARPLAMLLGAGYIGLIGMALFSGDIIFQPHESSYRDSDLDANPGTEHVRIKSGDATISAVHLKNASAKYTLLYSHGNGEDIGDDLQSLMEFRDAGFEVFAYDYRGYGTSTGRPSEEGIYEDVDAAYQYLTHKAGVSPGEIISFGHSLGAAAAIELASRRPVAGLIVYAPFVSAFRVMTRVKLLPWDKFDNGSRIGQVHCPVLVVHGLSDEVIPSWHGKRLYELANEPKRHLWVEGAGHNDALSVARQEYLGAVKVFSETLSSGLGPSGAGEIQH